MENPIKMDALGVPLFSETSTKTPCNIDEKIGLAAENVLQHQFCIPKTVMKKNQSLPLNLQKIYRLL